MSSTLDQAADANPTKGLNLLSFDAGGPQGVSQLYILNHLMEDLFRDENNGHQGVKPPCEIFDMIGGTGTGGLIAIFLTVFKMTAKDALEEFTRFTVQVFQDVARDPRKQTRKLERAIEGIFERLKVKKNVPIIQHKELEPPPSCKLVVPIMYKHHFGSICVLRNYRSRQEPSIDLTVAQAMLATCATAPMFVPTRIDKDFATFEYISGQINCSNPIRVVIAEAHCAFGGDAAVSCLLSIGCGVNDLSNSEATARIDALQQEVSCTISTDSHHFDANYVPPGSEAALQIEYLERIVMDGERTASEAATHMGKLGIYHRFSPSRELGPRSPSESIEPKFSTTPTKAYLADLQTGKLVDDCLDTIRAGDVFTTLEILVHLGGSKIPPPSLPPLTPIYVERKQQMDFLTTTLLDRDGSTKMGSKIVVVTGKEGSGKTQLIRYFLEEHGNRFVSCFYVDGSSKDTTRRDIVRHVRAISDGHSHDRFDESIAFLLEPVFGGERLLIFDNVDEPSPDFISSLPRWVNGTIITTSRNQSWDQLSPTAHLKLDLMTLDESIELLVRGTGLKWPPSHSDKESATVLAEELGRHPSTLVKATNAMYETGYSLRAYISRHRRKREVSLAAVGQIPAALHESRDLISST